MPPTHEIGDATREVDVVVVGAGAAGLRAAQTLVRRGARVVVVEARDRVGGRMLSIPAPSGPLAIELGAEFVHGAPPILLESLADAGCIACDVRDDHWTNDDGELREAKGFWEEIEAFVEVAKRTKSPNSSIEAVLDATRDERIRRAAPRVRSYVEGFHAAHADRFSAHAFAEEESAQEQAPSAGEHSSLQRVIDGYGALARHLAASIPDENLRLGTIVESIQWSKGRVSIEARGADGAKRPLPRARAVIVTLPLGVLKTRALRFTPETREIEDKMRAVDALAVGSVFRAVLRFSSPIWRRWEKGGRAIGFVHDATLEVPTFWTMRPLHAPWVVAWAGGPVSERLHARAENDRLRVTLDCMARAFALDRADVERAFVGWHHHDWDRDPFTLGAYSWVPIGALRVTKDLQTPVENTIFFAGEATAEGEHGTVHGAMKSGERAAREVAQVLQLDVRR